VSERRASRELPLKVGPGSFFPYFEHVRLVGGQAARHRGQGVVTEAGVLRDGSVLPNNGDGGAAEQLFYPKWAQVCGVIFECEDRGGAEAHTSILNPYHVPEVKVIRQQGFLRATPDINWHQTVPKISIEGRTRSFGEAQVQS